MPSDLEKTRRHLHGVAELLIAGPQYRSHHTIRLAVVPGGIRGAQLPIGIEGADLVWTEGRTPLTGTIRELAGTAGIEPGAPEGVYSDTSGIGTDDPIDVDPDSAGIILEWFATGDQALRGFAADQTPVLWPEHFDLGISVDELNYGISPGDANQPRPYAYVGPWAPRAGAFWNAPFGAMLTMEQASSVQALVEFFEEGRRQAVE